ncbi:MAG: hypothetical protein KIT72_03795 [Polyangiaceae bacterium]|nr:hypothetical protein [Polyangiaceae bacterium]MCW5789525.1 hypothetical protein [Polyangiaceae bacterium]
MSVKLTNSGACLLYALGGGLGHAVRGACLARELALKGVRVTLLVAEHAGAAAAELLDPRLPEGVAELVALEPQEAAELRARVVALAERHGASMLWVDTFPDGIHGELRGLELPRLALLRARRDVPTLKAQLAGCRFALDLEPNLGWLDFPGVVPVGPVARTVTPAPLEADVGWVLSEPAQRPLLTRLATAMSDVSSRLVAPGEALMNSYTYRVVVGPAGYNLSYELARAGVWHVALPAPRRFDVQVARARALGALVTSPQALERRIRALLRHGATRRAPEVLDHRAVVERALRLMATNASP